MEYLTVKEASKLMDITVARFRMHVRKGTIPERDKTFILKTGGIRYLWQKPKILASIEKVNNYKPGDCLSKEEKVRKEGKKPGEEAIYSISAAEILRVMAG